MCAFVFFIAFVPFVRAFCTQMATAFFLTLPTKVQSVDDSHCEHQFEGAILIKFFWICCVCVVLVAFIFFSFFCNTRWVVGHLCVFPLLVSRNDWNWTVWNAICMNEIKTVQRIKSDCLCNLVVFVKDFPFNLSLEIYRNSFGCPTLPCIRSNKIPFLFLDMSFSDIESLVNQ